MLKVQGIEFRTQFILAISNSVGKNCNLGTGLLCVGKDYYNFAPEKGKIMSVIT